MDKSLTQLSKFLSLILRHEPGKIGLRLDEQGWAEVEELITRANASGKHLTRTLLDRIVADNDKQRFAFSPDGSKIRANQGHSIRIDPGLTPASPPEFLYHGTATRFLESIRQGGLISGNRLHVHLSPDEETAIKVGQRHGKPVVLTVKAREMEQAGLTFYRSENGVWLTEHVPVEFLNVP